LSENFSADIEFPKIQTWGHSSGHGHARRRLTFLDLTVQEGEAVAVAGAVAVGAAVDRAHYTLRAVALVDVGILLLQVGGARVRVVAAAAVVALARLQRRLVVGNVEALPRLALVTANLKRKIDSAEPGSLKNKKIKKIELRRSSKFERSLGRSVIENVLKLCANNLALLEFGVTPKLKFFKELASDAEVRAQPGLSRVDQSLKLFLHFARPRT
jgi:hypothetical protein